MAKIARLPETSKNVDAALTFLAWEIFRWQHCKADNFTAKIFDLLCKADEFNRARISKGFPLEVVIFTMWETYETAERFYESFGINLKKEKKEIE